MARTFSTLFTLLLTATTLASARPTYPHQTQEEYDAQTKVMTDNGACRFYYLPQTTHDPVDNKLDACKTKCGTNDPKKVTCDYDKLNDPFEEVWRWDPQGNLWGLGFCNCKRDGVNWIIGEK